MFNILRERNFRLLWFGQLVSVLGDQLLFLALPFYIYSQTQSTVATGLLLMAQTAPGILFSSLSGVFVDRWDRRKIMVTADIGRAVVMSLLLLVNPAEWLWLVFVVVFARCSISTVFKPAKDALLPTLVGKDRLTNANSLNSVGENVALVIGPALGGVLLGVIGFKGVLTLDILSFLVSALLIYFIRYDSRPVAKAESTTIAQKVVLFWRDWLEGIQLAARQPSVASLFIVIGITFFAQGLIAPLTVPFVQDVMRGDAQTFGWLILAQGIGGILGGFLIGQLAKKLAPQKIVAVCLAVIGGVYLITFQTALFWAGLVLFPLFGMAVVGVLVSANLILQTSVEDRFRGRIFGAYGTLIALTTVIGTSVGAPLAAVIGIMPVLTVGAGMEIILSVVALWFWRTSQVGKLESSVSSN
jgi:predicted MFS family arabinose efflux permease